MLCLFHALVLSGRSWLALLRRGTSSKWHDMTDSFCHVDPSPQASRLKNRLEIFREKHRIVFTFNCWLYLVICRSAVFDGQSPCSGPVFIWWCIGFPSNGFQRCIRSLLLFPDCIRGTFSPGRRDRVFVGCFRVNLCSSTALPDALAFAYVRFRCDV